VRSYAVSDELQAELTPTRLAPATMAAIIEIRPMLSQLFRSRPVVAVFHDAPFSARAMLWQWR